MADDSTEKFVQLNVRLPTEWHQFIRIRALELGLTLTQYITYLVELEQRCLPIAEHCKRQAH